MEINELLKEYRRFCDKQGSCWDCKLDSTCFIRNLSDEEMDRTIRYIEKWSSEHPIKTYLTDFLEKFPNAPCREDGVPLACVQSLAYASDCCGSCKECWNTALEE